MRYRVKHVGYDLGHIIIDNGYQILRENGSDYVEFLGTKVVWDPICIAIFDNEKDANAVCQDLNHA